MATPNDDPQLYSGELRPYWTRAANQVDYYSFPELCFDQQGRPLAVGVFLQIRPRVNLMGAVGARDVSTGFRLRPSEMLIPGAYLLLDVCLTVREARRAAWYYRREDYPLSTIVVFAHPDCRSLLRGPFFRYPMCLADDSPIWAWEPNFRHGCPSSGESDDEESDFGSEPDDDERPPFV